MRIGELSTLTGVSIATIRLYEREGLIAPATRTEGRFREFTAEQERRLGFIKRVRNLGFSLEDVKALLAPSESRSAEDTTALIERIRAGIAQRRMDLAALDDRLVSSFDGDTGMPSIEEAFSSAN